MSANTALSVMAKPPSRHCGGRRARPRLGIPPLVKDVSVLVKPLRNPAEQPAEKSSSDQAEQRHDRGSSASACATCCRRAASWETPAPRRWSCESCLTPRRCSPLRRPCGGAAHAAGAVLAAPRALPCPRSLRSWSADGAAEAVVHACLGALRPGPAPAKAEWVGGWATAARRVVSCRAAAGRLVVLAAVRSVALSLGAPQPSPHPHPHPKPTLSASR